jgi:hypothetical protein
MYDGFTWAVIIAGNVNIIGFMTNLGRAWKKGKNGYYNGSTEFATISDPPTTPRVFAVALTPEMSDKDDGAKLEEV